MKLILRDEFEELLDNFDETLGQSSNAIGISNLCKWWARRKPLAARIFFAAACAEDRKSAYALIDGRDIVSGVSVYDPFAGGGTFVIEPATMGADAYGCDISPISALNCEGAAELYNNPSMLERIKDDVADFMASLNWRPTSGVDRCPECNSRNIRLRITVGTKHNAESCACVKLSESHWYCLGCDTMYERTESCPKCKVTYEDCDVFGRKPNGTVKRLKSRVDCLDCKSAYWDDPWEYIPLYPDRRSKYVAASRDEGVLKQAKLPLHELISPDVIDFAIFAEEYGSALVRVLVANAANSCAWLSRYFPHRISPEKVAKGGNIVYWMPNVCGLAPIYSPTERKINSMIRLSERLNRAADSINCVVHCGDSTTYSPPQEVDIVFTDPPYFDALAYNDISYYIAFLLDAMESDTAEEAIGKYYDRMNKEAVAGSIDEFANMIGTIYKRAADSMKDDGIFMFTYHHRDPEAIASIVKAMKIAGLVPERVWVYLGEVTTSIRMDRGDRGVYDMLVVCRKESMPRIRQIPKTGVKEIINHADKLMKKYKTRRIGDALTFAYARGIECGYETVEEFARIQEEIVRAFDNQESAPLQLSLGDEDYEW